LWDVDDTYFNTTTTTTTITTSTDNNDVEEISVGGYLIALFPWLLSMALVLVIVCMGTRNSSLPSASDGRTVCTSVDESENENEAFAAVDDDDDDDDDDGGDDNDDTEEKEIADEETGKCTIQQPRGRNNDTEDSIPGPKQEIVVVVVPSTPP